MIQLKLLCAAHSSFVARYSTNGWETTQPNGVKLAWYHHSSRSAYSNRLP